MPSAFHVQIEKYNQEKYIKLTGVKGGAWAVVAVEGNDGRQWVGLSLSLGQPTTGLGGSDPLTRGHPNGGNAAQARPRGRRGRTVGVGDIRHLARRSPARRGQTAHTCCRGAFLFMLSILR